MNIWPVAQTIGALMRTKIGNSTNRLTATVFLLLSAFSVALAQKVSLAPYHGGRQAALSLTFDDGLSDQYTLAYPELRRRGLRATFAIIGSKVGGKMRSKQDGIEGTDGTPCMTWDMLREMTANGMEITSHGWSHQAVTRLDKESLRYEVQHNDTVIYEQTGQFPRTFFYPGNAKSDACIAFCEQDRVGSRTFQTSIGSKRDTMWLYRWVEGLIAQGEWGVGMTHGIACGYDHFKDPQVMWAFLDYLTERQDRVWVAPFCEVAAYVKERKHTQLAVSKTGGRLLVKPVCMIDARLFRQPLTMVVEGDAPLHVIQDGKELNVCRKDGVTLVDFNPHGGEIVVSY